jgi:DNA-binding transcriptional MerR regulator
MPVSQEGKEHVVNGKKIMLYPISVLAERLSKALGDERTTQTIRKWETNKIIPPATFRNGDKRLYAKEQIDVICKIAKECGIKQGYSLSLTNFSVRVWEEMRKVNRKLLGK